MAPLHARLLLVAVLSGAAALAGSAPAPALSARSLLVRGGLLVDGTGAPRRRADLRIVGDRIERIGRLIPRPGERVLDARGLVVAPGFIDAHSHVDFGLEADPTAAAAIRQGITTAVVGQDGGSPLPLAAFFRRLESQPVALNLAAFAGHGTIRRQVLGAAGEEALRRPAGAEALERMRAQVRAEMASGALGLSTGLEYDPGIYASTEELIACAEAARDGLYISHLRDEGDGVFEALRELLRIAGEAGVPAQVSHLKLASRAVRGRAEEALRLLDDAGRRGLDLSFDVYPYVFWSSTITAMTTRRDFENLEVWRKALEDVGGPERVRLARFRPNPAWEGKTIAELARETRLEPAELVRHIVRETRGLPRAESVIVTAMEEADLRRFMRHPRGMFCSDGGLAGSHPRLAGSFPRVLGRYVREARLLSLEEAVRKMTALPADRFGFRDRGRLKVGWKADLTLFAPERVRDRATVANPTAPPEGIVWVVVNGTVVVERGRVTGARPGRVLRRAGRLPRLSILSPLSPPAIPGRR